MSQRGLAARQGAATLTSGVLDRRVSLADQIAAPDGPLARLQPADRARAQALAMAVLRHLGRIDAVLARFLDRPPPAPARIALRLAAAELNVMATPPHAAVDAAVRLAQAHPGGRRLSGLVNAVARRVAEGGADLWAAMPEAALPDWLAVPVARAYGEEAAAAIAAAHARDAPPVDLTLRDPLTTDEWAAQLQAEVLPTGSLRLTRPGQVSALPGFAEGAWWVQDAAAALPVRMLGDLRGCEALDLCAAPGGKTLQLAAAGARVTALDISQTRLDRLRENLARTGLAAEIVVADGTDWRPDRRFDAIVLDAPCSATGTLRRHPDLPHLRDGSEVAALCAAQARLLGRAWDRLAPGGRLVFATCSLLPAEGEDIVAAFLATTPGADQAVPVLPGLDPQWLDASGGLRLRPDYWSGRGGMDGFHAALLERPGGGDT